MTKTSAATIEAFMAIGKEITKIEADNPKIAPPARAILSGSMMLMALRDWPRAVDLMASLPYLDPRLEPAFLAFRAHYQSVVLGRQKSGKPRENQLEIS